MIALFLNSAYAASNFMPPAATEVSRYFDTLYSFLLVASFVACVLVIGGLAYFAIKYRRQSETQKSAYISHNNALEFAWSFIPFLIFMFAFAWGWWVYVQFRTMPKDALEIHVIGQKWNWTFLYNSGRTSSADLYIPVDTPVKLIMTSKDVIHSFFVPAFREKQDVVPGRYSQLWFQVNQPGNYQVFCAEYCGAGHSTMMAKVHVLPLKDYEHWLATDPYRGLSLADVGKKIYTGKCVACHNLTADRKIGPGFLNVFGSKQPLDDGSEVLADENYVRESILYPNAKIVRTYPKNVMPSFQGQLTEQELSGVIEFLKTLKQ
jgi:cytochrome c oxidase subunit 2